MFLRAMEKFCEVSYCGRDNFVCAAECGCWCHADSWVKIEVCKFVGFEEFLSVHCQRE